MYLEQENRELREEIERKNDEERWRQEDEYRKSEEARRTRQRERQEALCEASSWSEAFSNGIARLILEAREEAKCAALPDWEGETYFADEVKATRFAHSLYQQAMSNVEQTILNGIADAVEKEFPKASVVSSLRDNDYNQLVDW